MYSYSTYADIVYQQKPYKELIKSLKELKLWQKFLLYTKENCPDVIVATYRPLRMM